MRVSLFRSSISMMLVSSLLLLPGAFALSPADWRKQSIYQVVTDRFARTDLSTTAACDTSQGVYCGGTWQGLISKLDYIQGMGFTAIWISPVVKQMDGDTSDGESYHGYWAQDIYSVNSAFGSASDLVALSAALHKRGMYLMVDVVTNHMGFDGCETCVDYSVFNPFSSSSYFHSPCTIDYNNQTSIQVCWEGDNIVSLPDLRTEDTNIRTIWNNWIKALVANYTIDGLRIDSAKHQETSFWAGFETAGGVFMMGEVYEGDPAYVAPYQQYLDGLLDYPSYYWITQAFESTSGSISNLANGINTLKGDALNSSLYGSFLENHDQARFPSLTSDMSLAKNAIAFTMLKDGIPIIYQGQEQHYAGTGTPNNREALWLSGYSTTATLYTFIKQLNAIRSAAIATNTNYLSYQAWPIYSDSHNIAMRKGYAGTQVVGVFSNVGAGGSASFTLPQANSGFSANMALMDMLSCTNFTADSSGNLAVTISGGLPRVFFPQAALSGTGLCGATTSTTTAGTTATATVACTATAVQITFNELETTSFGDTIKIAGSVPALGNWAPANAVALGADSYTSSNPLWSGSISLTPGSVVEYKYIKVDSSGSVTWEADPNHTYTIPCAAATKSDTWQT